MAPRPIKMAYELHKNASAFNQNPIVIMHGLLGCKRNWRSIARALNSRGFGRVYCVDARNHGTSPWSSEMSYKCLAEDILTFLTDLKSTKVSLIGHSMGGKAAMVAALMKPSLVHRLVVVDIAPHTSPNRENLESIISLMNLVDLRSKMAGSLHGLRLQLMDEWKEVIPSFHLRSFILNNLRESNGEATWSVNVPILHKNLRDLSGFPYSQYDTASYNDPALFVAGEISPFLQPDKMPYVVHFFPRAKRVVIANAGHWVHVEAPELLADVVTDFINQ